MKFEKTVVILTPNRNLEFFLAEFVPYFVSALDHIYPLCSAVSASSGANSAQKSFSTFLSGISISFLRRHVRRRKHFSRNECRNVGRRHTLRHRVKCILSRRQSLFDFVYDLNRPEKFLACFPQLVQRA